MKVGTCTHLISWGDIFIKKKWGVNNVSGRSASWSHGEGITQNIKKICHHEQQRETTPVRQNTKRVVWPTEQCTTVLQETYEGSWGIWFPYQPIRPMCGKQDDKWQTDDGSMTCVWPKGVTCWQFWSHQICRIPVKYLWRTISAQGEIKWLFGNWTRFRQTSNSEGIHDKIPR